MAIFSTSYLMKIDIKKLCLLSVKYCGNCLSMSGFPTFLHLLAPPRRPRHPPTETGGTLDTDDDLQTLHYLSGILPKQLLKYL